MATPEHHGHAHIRGAAHPTSTLTQGRFGRLFRNLPPYGHQGDEAFVKAVAELTRRDGPMADSAAEERTGWAGRDPDDPGESVELHAGLTYFGQFIDHDVTFDPTSQLDRENDPDALHSFRTPRLELDSLYGAGPEADPHLYEPQGGGRLAVSRRNPQGKFVDEPPDQAQMHTDLPRVEGSHLALAGDPRNDENRILGQLHLTVVEFHNAVMERTGGDFAEARRIVRWCFQHLVVHDFLAHLVPAKVAQELFPGLDLGHALRALAGQDAGRHFAPRLYRPRNAAFVPVEFAAAAYRFGHTLVNPKYTLNDSSGERPIFGAVGEDLRGGSPLPRDLVIDWARFFPVSNGTSENLQHGRRLNVQIAEPLLTLPFITPKKDAVAPGTPADEIQRSLAFRNVLRGVALGLPSGQAVAQAVGAEYVLANAEIHEELDTEAWKGEAPLWLYVLGEAGSDNDEVGGHGEQLGYVGATIVAETLLGMLARDPMSYWNVHPRWKPEVELDGALVGDDGEFTVAHLLGAPATLVS